MSTLASVAELLVAVMAVVAVIRRRRAALREHPPLDYAPAAVPWRWAAPPEGLGVRQADGVSVLELPWRRPAGAIVAELAAYAFGLFVVGMAVMGLINEVPPLLHLFAFGMFVPLVMVCLRMATRLSHIELRPDSVTFIERGGLWWHRHRRWRRPIRVTGRMQSAFSLGEGQDPAHDVLVRGRLFGVRMRSHCDQSMGSWMVGGLTAWSEAG